MNCEICKRKTDIELVYCCSGHDCACGGGPVNEESILCEECKEVVEYLEKHEATVFNCDGDEIWGEV